MRSSYIINNYESFFEGLVRIHDPKLIVECGVLDGYSLISMARGAKKTVRVVGFDLFEDYEFKHGSVEAIEFEAWKSNVDDKITLVKKDAILAAEDFDDETVDLLHIDISNDGDNLRQMFNVWGRKIKKGGLFVFEGGSEERDSVEWMVKYKKTPIKLFKDYIKLMSWDCITFLPYPSLTVCTKPL